MLRSGVRVSSPYSAADSKPTKLVNANINERPSAPPTISCGEKESTGNAAEPRSPTTRTSSTIRTPNSSTISTPSTRAERSALRKPKNATIATLAAVSQPQATCTPDSASTRWVK